MSESKTVLVYTNINHDFMFIWDGNIDLKVDVYKGVDNDTDPVTEFILVPWFDSLHVKSAMIEFKFSCEKWIENDIISREVAK